MKYTLKFRIWHWLNAAVVLGLLGTVFLRKTFLSWRENSVILMNKLNEFDISITELQAKVLAKSIRAGMWEWHIILGYALAFLMIYRIFLYFKDSSIKENFNELTLHKKGVKSLYYIVYTTLFFMSISGFIIYFYAEIGLTKESAHDIKELHEALFNVLFIFVPLHIAGLIIAENGNQKGVVSTMINGREA